MTDNMLTPAQVAEQTGITPRRLNRIKNDDPNMAKFVKIETSRFTVWDPGVVAYLNSRTTLKHRKAEKND